MLALAQGSAYIERTCPEQSCQYPQDQKGHCQGLSGSDWKDIGFSLVEVLSPCPTNWKMSPVEAWKWIDEVMA